MSRDERHGPLVSCETLERNLSDDAWVVFDVRHELMDPDAGPAAYADGHIPSAFHAHIDHDLSAPVGDGRSGRHPLPDMDAFEAFLRNHGVNPDSQIICYDDAGGMWAGRLWWLCRYIGLKHVAVLDGGLARWNALGLDVTTDVPDAPGNGTLEVRPGAMPIVGLDELAGKDHILDARAPERYRGDVEPVDPAAGHIPGAINMPFAGNLAPDGMFLSPDELRARYEGFTGDVAVYCGSGVTAAHDVLAMEVAGLPTPALSPESWSGWSTQGREVAVGASA